jgi:hypothetical protein
LYTDRYGLELSTCSSLAVAHYVRGVDLLLSQAPGADIEFEAALSADPAFAMAHAALARFHQSWGRAAQARTAIAAAVSASTATSTSNQVSGRSKSSVSRREQQHIAILSTLIDGNAPQALRLLLEHLDEFARDALALGMALGAFGLLAFSGRPDHDAVRLGLSERMAYAYGEDWWFLGYLAWAHIEAGSLIAGERHIERSLALKADNANAIHVFAHLTYEQNRASESIARLDSLTANYDTRALLHNHLRWHAALGELAGGHADAALAIYDHYLSPAVATAPLITAISDAVSLLWRIQIATGQPVGAERWRALAEFIKARHYQSTVAFLDLHVAALYSVTGDTSAFESLTDQLKNALDNNRLPAGRPVIDLCEALEAFVASDTKKAVQLLEANLGNVVRIGGSGAQRDLFEETLTAAYARSGDRNAISRAQSWQKARAGTRIPYLS